jgi:pyruvate,water dikinase
MRSRIRRFRPDGWTSDTRFAAYEQAITDLKAAALESLTWSELLRLPDQAFAALEGLIDLRVDYLPRMGVDLVRLRVWLMVLGLNGASGDLIAAGHTRTADANRRLDELADLIRHDAARRQDFLDQPLPTLADRLDHDKTFSGLRSALHDYTEEFGHRETTSAFLMSAPTWGEDLELLLSTLQARIRRPASPRTSPAEETERRILATRRVRWSRTGGRLSAAIQAARSAIVFREDTHFHAVRALPIVRRSLLEAGSRLARAGVLESRDDILHLRLTEVTAIPDPDAVDAAQREVLRSTVEQRQRARAELAGAPLISPASLYRPASTTFLAAGTPVGGGRATGAVRLVLGPEEFGRLQPGEILVCPYTNPSWTLLFQVAAGVVVDTGGVGSHAAIVAREYGIPAVMGTGNGTKRLQDGQRVTVDGTTGRVRAEENSR